MDHSDNMQYRVLDGDIHARTSIVLTATLAITGIGVPSAPPEGSTAAERIEAIHRAVLSGVIKLQPISSLQGRTLAYSDNSAPKPEPKDPPRPGG
jgi:hypothetical protein